MVYQVLIIDDRVNGKNFDSAVQKVLHIYGEKILASERNIVDQSVKAWDRWTKTTYNPTKVEEIQSLFKDTPNIVVCDYSNPKDMPETPFHEVFADYMLNNGGCYPGGADLIRIEALSEPGGGYPGGVYIDFDTECLTPLPDQIYCHPDLALVGQVEDPASSRKEGVEPYIDNAMLAAHPGSELMTRYKDFILNNEATRDPNSVYGSKRFDKPNVAVQEETGPSALRLAVDSIIRDYDPKNAPLSSLWDQRWEGNEGEQPGLFRALNSHMSFPEGCLNPYTEVQISSAVSNIDVAWLTKDDIEYMRQDLLKKAERRIRQS